MTLCRGRAQLPEPASALLQTLLALAVLSAVLSAVLPLARVSLRRSGCCTAATATAAAAVRLWTDTAGQTS
jgi:hypothetical protein